MSDGAGKYGRLAKSGIENLSQHFFDSYEESNAKVRSEAGLKMIVVREEIGDCCSWCADLAGVYDYDSVPKEVWARHANCRCMVTTRTEKGTWQDAWSRKEYDSYKEARQEREKELIEEQPNYAKTIKESRIDVGVGKNITAEYIEKAKPGQGERIYEDGFVKEKNANEINVGKWLHETFGGDLIHINEFGRPDGEKNPDYLWRGRLWDLKTVSTEAAANSALRSGMRQIRKNPGGIVLDYGDHRISYEELGKVIEERIKWKRNMPLDIIIKQGKRFSVIHFD